MNICAFVPPTGVFWIYLETPGCAPIAKHIHTKHVHRRMSEWDTKCTTDLGFMCSPK